MSIKLMSDVWRITDERITGTVRLALLALADNASDEGVCWPSYATIARKCAISRTHAINTVKKLIEYGCLSKHARYAEGEQTSNVYSLTIPPGWLTPVNPPSQPQLTPVVNPSLPESSFNHQLTKREAAVDVSDMQALAEKITRLPAKTPADAKAIDEWERMGITEDDIRGALAWRIDNGHGAANTIAQLSRGVLMECKKRVQTSGARRTSHLSEIERLKAEGWQFPEGV